MREALKHLPPNINGAYEDVLQHVHAKNPEARDLAYATLAWVLYANRPLTLTELLDALSIEESSRTRDPDNMAGASQMLSSCAGLVTVESGDETVHFAHYSVQEYLLKRSGSISILSNVDLAKICLTYLNFDEFECGPISGSDLEAYLQRLQDFPFLSYSAGNWTHHVKGDGEQEAVILSAMESLFSSRRKWDHAMMQTRYTKTLNKDLAHTKLDIYPQSSTVLHVAASSGLTSVQ
jgi:hypothetical protein